ncbi:hypothetical protein CK203_092773 [Vitis vinifera]|uniref:Uncharacterized protein n=1 Tax=Vitis vinifera TaxID=29760 RepID=A0A438EP55_VITVI|nr:hypothetical protein CK203_092773 [Vitis vinifera]
MKKTDTEDDGNEEEPEAGEDMGNSESNDSDSFENGETTYEDSTPHEGRHEDHQLGCKITKLVQDFQMKKV